MTYSARRPCSNHLPVLRRRLRRVGHAGRQRRRDDRGRRGASRRTSGGCARRAALGETLGLEDASAPPDDARTKQAQLGRGARPCRAEFKRVIDTHGPDVGRVLCLGPAAHRGLLRRQQADEGLHRHRQHRHQLAAVHGLRGRRPQPRVRRRRGAADATRISTRPTSIVLVGLQHRVVPSGHLSAHASGAARARRQDRRHRSAPHGDRRRARICTCRSGGHGRRSCSTDCSSGWPITERSIGASSASTRVGLGACACARARDRAGSIAATASDAASTAPTSQKFYELFERRRTRVVTCYSQGVNQSAQGTDKVNAIINCHLATGRIGKPGAGSVLADRAAQRHGRPRGRRARQHAGGPHGL